MFVSFLVSIVNFSRKFALPLVGVALVLSLALGAYVTTHIAINTDINQILSDKLAWRQREKDLEKAFPQKTDTLVIVIDSDNGDKVDAAAGALARRLTEQPQLFSEVYRPDALPFFRTNGLLYLSERELGETLDQISQAQPLLGTMISDPSLRGFFGTIGMMLQGVQAGAIDPKQVEAPLTEVAVAFKAALSGQEYFLDWRKMMPESTGTSNPLRELRRYIITKPVLNYKALQPGEAATRAVRQAVAELGLTRDNGLKVRLTGSVPLNDDEFASVAEGTGSATFGSAAIVIALLFLALRSWRIVVPIAVTLLVGLIASTAFATLAVGTLNLISVAFAVMFIGIAVDFGIQFGVRYRDQRHKHPDHAQALRHTAAAIAVPLTMAAGSTALGFLAFIPTSYRGVSELGLIAGAGMIIAFILNITLLPALMTLVNPPAEEEGAGFAFLAPLNAFLIARRKTLIPVIGVIALIGLGLASQVRFDFDPLNLKNPKVESVATMFDAIQDPDSDAYAAQILASSQEEAMKLAAQFEALPEVDHVMTLASFVPEDQDKKLAQIADTTSLLAATFALPEKPAATDEDNLNAMRRTLEGLYQAGDKFMGAQKLAAVLNRVIAQYTPQILARAQDNIVLPMRGKMNEIKMVIQAKKVTLADIPHELRRDWVTPEGKWLVEIFPKRGADNNPRDPKMLNHFLDAIQKVDPRVAGTPVSIRESGRTIITAFIQAGIYGLVSIALLSLLVLRRPRDVAIMMIPLLIAGILTLATMTVIGLPLNFANIIALPLLLSLGVSYAVYFVSYGRAGHSDFLQSSMAKAVLFSAATVLVAFASLCFSSHPGTQSMGELLTIALLYSLLCTFLMLPVLFRTNKRDTSL